MGKLKYTSNGVVIQNELTISGSDGTSVNVKEKLDSLASGDTVIYNGEFNADVCSASGIYQYITLGRAGLDTTTDDYYSLLVMKTSSNSFRQIAFGTKQHSNVYSRVCVNNDWGDTGSTYTFQKIGNINTINLTSANEITAKQSLVELAGDSVFYITNANNVFPGYGTVTVTTDNFKQLLELLSDNDAVKAFKSNWEAYYQINSNWYSQNISSYLIPPTFHVGDKIKLFKKIVTINDYFKKLIDWQSIDIYDKLTTAEKGLWTLYKLGKGWSSLSDGQCVVNMINEGDIYAKYTGGSNYMQINGGDSITIYDYEVIPDPAYTNTYNVIASGTTEYVPFTLTEAKQIYISFSNGITANNWELQKDNTKIITGIALAAGEYYHCGVLAAGEYRISWNSGNGTAMVSEYIRVTEASLKQDKLSDQQIDNINNVPDKQDMLSDDQLFNINNASIIHNGEYYAGACSAAGWYDEIRTGRPEGSESDEYYVLYTSDNGAQICYSKKNSGKVYHRANTSDLWTLTSRDRYVVDELSSAALNTYLDKTSCDYDKWINNGGDEPSADTVNKLLEVYAGYWELEKKKINLYQAINVKPNSIIKVRCFYRKSGSPTDMQYNSDAYVYLSNSVNSGHGIANIQSDYVKVKSLGSYQLSEYPDTLTKVRNNFFTDNTEYGWQYIKTNNLTEGTYYLHIEGTFDTLQSWFCLGETYVYTPSDIKESIDAKQDKLTAGSGITISDNVISSEQTVYEAGENIEISDNVISANVKLNSDLKYSGVTIETSGDTIVEALNKVVKEIVDDEQAEAAALYDLNKKKQNSLTAGSGIIISGNVISSEIKIDSDLEYSGVTIETSGDTVVEALDKVVKEIVDNELTTAEALYGLNTNKQNAKLDSDLTYDGETIASSGDTIVDAITNLFKVVINNEKVEAKSLVDLNEKIESTNDSIYDLEDTLGYTTLKTSAKDIKSAINELYDMIKAISGTTNG